MKTLAWHAPISSYKIAFRIKYWFSSKVIDIEGRNVGMRLVGLKQITPASGNTWERTTFAASAEPSV